MTKAFATRLRKLEAKLSPATTYDTLETHIMGLVDGAWGCREIIRQAIPGGEMEHFAGCGLECTAGAGRHAY